MEEESNFNLEGAYNQIKEEQPFPWKAKCLDCGVEMITELKGSYMPEKNKVIHLFRPAYCPDCEQQNSSLMVKVVAAIGKNGELHPLNKKGRVK